mmetsp:Transcript_8836/g.24412  ORF Transcript_8836/g.24412 Transcript_8836/m.24412 type:complete len:208 (-) Transcript_8836:842-1465(-)
MRVSLLRTLTSGTCTLKALVWNRTTRLRSSTFVWARRGATPRHKTASVICTCTATALKCPMPRPWSTSARPRRMAMPRRSSTSVPCTSQALASRKPTTRRCTTSPSPLTRATRSRSITSGRCTSTGWGRRGPAQQRRSSSRQWQSAASGAPTLRRGTAPSLPRPIPSEPCSSTRDSRRADSRWRRPTPRTSPTRQCAVAWSTPSCSP